MKDLTVKITGELDGIRAARWGDVTADLGLNWRQAEELICAIWGEAEDYHGQDWFLDLVRREGFKVSKTDSETGG